MTNIRPVSDLRNNFPEISRIVHETGKPVFLTKNGYGDMVVMSLEAYDDLAYQFEVFYKLREAERAEEQGAKRYPMDQVMSSIDEIIEEAENV